MVLPGKNKIKPETLWWISLFAILLFFHANHPLDSDEGVILEGAWNLINGRELYIDFFEFVPPGSFYLVFWIWKVLGISYWSANLLGILTVFLSSIGIYKISKQIFKSKLNHLPPAIFILSSFYWPLINHNAFNILFIIWAVYFFIKGLNVLDLRQSQDYKPAQNNFILSGLFTAGAILFLQQKGLALLLALFSFLVILFFKQRKLIWLKLNFYYLIFAIAPLSLLLLKWPAALLYENLILFPVFNYYETNKGSLFLFYFFASILFLVIFWLSKKRSISIWLLGWVQIFFLLTTIPNASYYHITLILFPLYSFLPLIIDKINLFHKKTKYLYYSAISIVFLLITFPSFSHVFYFTPFYSIKNSKVFSYIKENCPSKNDLYAGAFIPGLYFESRKLNLTPYAYLITNHQTEAQFSQAAKLLEIHKPKCAVLNYSIVEKFNYNKDNPVDNYIKNNYDLVSDDAGMLVYEIKKF